jgi:hypothetical protein
MLDILPKYEKLLKAGLTAKGLPTCFGQQDNPIQTYYKIWVRIEDYIPKDHIREFREGRSGDIWYEWTQQGYEQQKPPIEGRESPQQYIERLFIGEFMPELKKTVATHVKQLALCANCKFFDKCTVLSSKLKREETQTTTTEEE